MKEEAEGNAVRIEEEAKQCKMQEKAIVVVVVVVGDGSCVLDVEGMRVKEKRDGRRVGYTILLPGVERVRSRFSFSEQVCKFNLSGSYRQNGHDGWALPHHTRTTPSLMNGAGY